MATKISNILVRTIVFFAVIGILFLLTMYNAKLLYTLNWFKTENQLLDRLVIIIAAVAYSLGSIAVVIWYNPTKKHDESKINFKLRYSGSVLLKLLFVIIDGVHVYVYNNTHIEDLAKYLSPVYAIQTALILFFVGAIVNDIIKNGAEKELKNSQKQDEINSLQTHIGNYITEITILETDIEGKKYSIEKKQTEIEKYKSQSAEYLSQIMENKSEIKKLQTYRMSFLKSEKSRILKKKEGNRTDEELIVLEEAFRS